MWPSDLLLDGRARDHEYGNVVVPEIDGKPSQWPAEVKVK